MTRINTNVSSLVGRNNLQQANASLSQSLTRLSTGLRINTGKDDPAGLIASENLRSDITAIRRAIGNTDRANQVIATADSALGQVSSLLNDIRGLVTESANAGALSDEQIAANQLQVDSSLEALNRIAQTTTFQGRRLLDGSLDFVTSPGANAASLSNLQIDQANLGATGQVGVDVNVSAAATQAAIAVDGLPDVTPTTAASVSFDIETTTAVGSTGTVNFTPITADSGQGTATIGLTSQASGTFSLGGETVTLAARAGGAFDAAAGNAAVSEVNVDVGNAGVAANGAEVSIAGSVVTVAFNDASVTTQEVLDAINNDTSGALSGGITFNAGIAAADFSAATSGPGTGAIGSDVASNTATVALAGGGTETLTLAAVEDGPADGAEISAANSPTIAFTSNAAADSAAYNAGTNTLTVNINSAVTTNRTFQDIANLIAGAGEFTVNGSSTTPTLTNGGFVAGTTGATIDTNTGALTVTADGSDATTGPIASIDIVGTLAAGASGDIDIDFTEAALGAGAGPTRVIGNATSGYTVQVNSDDPGGVTIENIETALETIAEVDTATITAGAGSVFNAFDVASIDELPTTTQSLTGGVTSVSTTETIDLTTAIGVTGNIDISFTEANLSGGGTNVIDNGVTLGVQSYTIEIDNSAGVSIESIRQTLEDLTEIGSAAFDSTSPGTSTYNAAADTQPGTINIVGAGAGTGTTGVDADIVFELSGSNGSEVLSFEAGTTLELLIAGVNAVSDATGVTASAINDGTSDTGIQFSSTAYGSNAFVDVNVIEEGVGGDFVANLTTGGTAESRREIGSDVVASVNGITATGDGNDLSINTATLDLSATVDAGFVGTIEFDIDGGGALFQLGPDVVSNQQARLGINSVNTAALGGVDGLLYQLGTGGDFDLSSDPTTAAAVVESAIDQVTSLRGRLGAFQRTSLETNRNALNDTLSNLTEAESSIRDADFAEETANLTRSQILVQSGTRVLAIANQNPQNVLALLG